MPNAVQGNSGLPAFKEHWYHFNLFDVLDLSEVVEVVIDACLIETRQHIQPSWVVVVPVDAEDRKFYAQ